MSLLSEKIFIFHCPTRDAAEFREIAAAAAKLKPHGRVLVNLSELADKSWYELPPGGSPWHEYACCNPAPFKFFPHPRIAPHLPADFVAANRELLLAKAAALKELGLEAAFWSYEPNILPESFFAENPRLRGARVDHPRRSRKEAFAMCVDLPETLEMTQWMVSELRKAVPGLAAFMFKTNDAGAGLCWSENLYSGANGPKHCAARGAGLRAKGLLEAIHKGAAQGGGDVDVHMSGYITTNELAQIQPHLPPRSFLRGRDRSSMSVSSFIDSGGYPVRGLVDVLDIIRSMERFDRPETRNVFVNLRASYDRGHDPVEAVSRVVEIMQDCIDHPCEGLTRRLERLRALCVRWAGEGAAEETLEAFVQLNDSLKLRRAAAGQLNPYTCGVSARHIVRPLVIKPELLTAEEEAYWLPHVFNVHEAEARSDYIDIHGGRIGGMLPGSSGRVSAVDSVAGGVLSAAAALEKAASGPAGKWLARQALGWRIWVCLLRSCNNFFGAQMVRDRAAQALAGPPRIPSKDASWFGDPGILEWNDIQRDEFDNASELIGLLEGGGLEMLSLAPDARHEDTFVLGPDVVGQLRKKCAIMRRHWLDVEKWLSTPFK